MEHWGRSSGALIAYKPKTIKESPWLKRNPWNCSFSLQEPLIHNTKTGRNRTELFLNPREKPICIKN